MEDGLPDLTTTLAAAAFAYVTKDGLNKLLGPTAEYFGGEIREFTRHRVEAVGKILKNATEKLGDKMDEPGAVPPRVLKAVMNEGSFYTENVSLEYIGGVLASSRTPQGRDDRGARMAKLVDRLSTYQLQTHYLIYSSIREIFCNTSLDLDKPEHRTKMQIYSPLTSYLNAMKLTPSDLSGNIFQHVFSGLQDEGLIGGRWCCGHLDTVIQLYPVATEPGFCCSPSLSGAELFLWAFGKGSKPLEFLFNSSFSPFIEGLPSCLHSAKSTWEWDR